MELDEAIKELKSGKVITHPLLGNDWIKLYGNNRIRYSDGWTCELEDFLKYKSVEPWKSGYRVINLN